MLVAVRLSPRARKTLGRHSVQMFGVIYFGHYFTHAIPDFHFELNKDLQDETIKFLEVIGFRGSAKSTLAALIYVIHQAVYELRHFIIPVSDTFSQAKLLIANIIYEFENNALLLEDFGAIYSKPREKGQKKTEWTATNILLTNKVRIFAKSRGQKMRGLRHQQYRPDLLVFDDIENADAVESQEQRDKLENWFFTDALPSMDTDFGKAVLLGNLLHEDSLVNRVKKKIQADSIKGVLREYPLFDKSGRNLWPEKFTDEIIKTLEGRGMIYYQREYLLKIVARAGQPIKRIGSYIELPKRLTEHDPHPIQRICIGVDLAISEKQTADETSINVLGRGNALPMYNLANHSGRWGFRAACDKIKEIYNFYYENYPWASLNIGVEDVAYQHAAVETLQNEGIPVIPIKQTRDKRARLETVAPIFDQDQILFPVDGSQDKVKSQILNFGVEPHDDCADAVEISIRLMNEYSGDFVRWV